MKKKISKFYLIMILLSCICIENIWADIDIASLTMGRSTIPAKSWLAETSLLYSAIRWSDPRRDLLQTTFDVEHGFNDRFAASLVFLFCPPFY